MGIGQVRGGQKRLCGYGTRPVMMADATPWPVRWTKEGQSQVNAVIEAEAGHGNPEMTDPSGDL